MLESVHQLSSKRYDSLLSSALYNLNVSEAQLFNQSINLSVNQSINQSVSQSVSQSVRKSVSQSVKLHCQRILSFLIQTRLIREARWPSGRVSDTGARGWGFNPHSGHRVVSLSMMH